MKSVERMRELAGIVEQDENDESGFSDESYEARMEILDQLRDELSDTEILETMIESLTNREAQENFEYVAKQHDMEIDTDIEFDVEDMADHGD